MARRDEGEVTVIETGGSAAGWFILGALVGAGIGLLLAPESGERTRRKISREARRLRREASERLDEFRDEMSDKGRHLKSEVEEWAEGVKEEVREGRRAIERKASSARDDLERRLADARARRRAMAPVDGVADDDIDEYEDEEDGEE